MRRCPPYTTWFPLKTRCERDSRIARISLRHDISVDGGPFYRLVDSENICALTYRPLARNDWIRAPEDGAPIMGAATKNPLKNSPARTPQRNLVDETRRDPPAPRPAWSVLLEKAYWGLWVLISGAGLWSAFRSLTGSGPSPRVRANP
jgi:hypothetical protein